MSENNTRVWDVLSKTDPAHTKKFSRSGGFSGTAVKPIWTVLRMTEAFGPCGIGWGMDKPDFTTQAAGEELLVFCTVAIWYSDNGVMGRVYGVGGDKFLISQKSGLRASDEAYKMAYTDAVGNALKYIGAAADVHMGLFDDNKYVNEMTREFAKEDTPEYKAAQERNKAALAVKYITSDQAKAFRAACVNKGLTADEVKASLLRSNIGTSAQIPAADFESWMKWLDEAEVAQ